MGLANSHMATMMKTHAVRLMFIATLTLGVGCGTRSQPPMVTKNEPPSSEPVAHPTTRAASPTTGPATLRRTRWEWRREETSEPAEILVYRHHSWGGRTFLADLILAVWADGEVIWSTDPVEGGSPYWRGRIDAPAFELLRERLTDIAAKSGVPADRVLTGPDASYNVLYFRTPAGRVFSVGSWSDPIERFGQDEQAWPRLAQSWREMQKAADEDHWNHGSIVRLWGALRSAVYEALPRQREQVQHPPLYAVRAGGV